MRAKMNIFGIFLSALCVILVAKCEEGHHIEQRILEEQESQNSSDNDLTVSSVVDVSPTPFNVSSLLRTNNSDQLFINVGIQPNQVDFSSNGAVQNETKTDDESDSNVPQSLISKQNGTNSETKNETSVDTEVKDLLTQNTQEKQDVLVEDHQHPFEPEHPIQIPDKIDKQTELIEDGENTEDELRRHRDEKVNVSSQGPLAIILVSGFVALSVLCYAGLLMWRKYLENRYGSRTLLVNADELNDPNDLKHFSI